MLRRYIIVNTRNGSMGSQIGPAGGPRQLIQLIQGSVILLRRPNVSGLFAGAGAVILASLCLTTSAGASTPLASVVSPSPVSWTPNVFAGPPPSGESTGCNSTFFGSSKSAYYCQSEVFSTAYVNGDVIVAGSFTEVCQPGPSSNGDCATGTAPVTRDDIFAYAAGTGVIDPNFTPVVNAGPVWTVAAGPAGARRSTSVGRSRRWAAPPTRTSSS